MPPPVARLPHAGPVPGTLAAYQHSPVLGNVQHAANQRGATQQPVAAISHPPAVARQATPQQVPARPATGQSATAGQQQPAAGGAAAAQSPTGSFMVGGREVPVQVIPHAGGLPQLDAPGSPQTPDQRGTNLVASRGDQKQPARL